MPYTTTQTRLGPEFTPPAIKIILILTSCIALGAALINPIFTQIFGIPGPEELFSLSYWGLRKFFIWQPVSYLFVQQSRLFGISLFYLLKLAFNLYIIWIIGTDIHQRAGKESFLKFYFLSAIFAGLCASLYLLVAGSYGTVSGATPAVLALLFAWMMFYPETQLLLFFVIPVKTKWLISGIIGFIFLSNLSQGNLLDLIANLSPIVFAYVYCVAIWDLQTPFEFTKPVDRFISKFADKIKHFLPNIKNQGKIISFKTLQEKSKLSDDEFIDTMLTKISKHGQDSLTWRERKRMNKISEKKRQNDPHNK